MIIINGDFLPILENIWDKLTHVKSVVIISEDDDLPQFKLSADAVYEALTSIRRPHPHNAHDAPVAAALVIFDFDLLAGHQDRQRAF